MRRIVVVVIALLFVAPFVLTTSPVHAARRTWTVLAGGGAQDSAIASNFFHPRDIDIGVGDTVTWKFLMPHTVTFLSGQKPPPNNIVEGTKVYQNAEVFFPAGGDTYDGTGYRNSGRPTDANATYSLTFTKPGRYEYVCLLHPGSVGTVTVKTHPSLSPAGAERLGRNEQAATLKAGQAAWEKWEPERQAGRVTVTLLGDEQAGYSFLRFTKQPLVVTPGTTVTWTNLDPFRPHSATFLGAEKRPDDVILEPQAQGPPKLLVNPRLLARTPSPTYEGGFANSGNLPPGSGASFSLTFTRPGQYEYVCRFHDAFGMKATVIVR